MSRNRGQVHCWVSVVLQCLHSVPELMTEIAVIINRLPRNSEDVKYRVLRYLGNSMQRTELEADGLNPHRLARKLCSAYAHHGCFQEGGHNDATELFQVLLQSLGENTRPSAALTDFAWHVRQLFSHSTCNMKHCPSCGGEAPIGQDQPGSSLKLSIRGSVQESLDHHFAPELVDIAKSKCILCGHVAHNARFRFRQCIDSVGKYLAVTLNRWQPNRFGRFVKDRSNVRLDPTITLTVTGVCHTFQLHTVINHGGSHNGGHYTLYREAGDKLFNVNDAQIRQVKHFPPRSTSAYLLVYKRVSDELNHLSPFPNPSEHQQMRSQQPPPPLHPLHQAVPPKTTQPATQPILTLFPNQQPTPRPSIPHMPIAARAQLLPCTPKMSSKFSDSSNMMHTLQTTFDVYDKSSLPPIPIFLPNPRTSRSIQTATTQPTPTVISNPFSMLQPQITGILHTLTKDQAKPLPRSTPTSPSQFSDLLTNVVNILFNTLKRHQKPSKPPLPTLFQTPRKTQKKHPSTPTQRRLKWRHMIRKRTPSQAHLPTTTEVRQHKVFTRPQYIKLVVVVADTSKSQCHPSRDTMVFTTHPSVEKEEATMPTTRYANAFTFPSIHPRPRCHPSSYGHFYSNRHQFPASHHESQTANFNSTKAEMAQANEEGCPSSNPM